MSLQELKLDRCTSLNYLNLGENPYLKTLSMGNCGSQCDVKSLRLEKLSINAKELNVKDLPALTELYVGSCNLKTLDLSGNPHLKKLTLSGTTVEKLDLSNNMEIETITCSGLKMQPRRTAGVVRQPG